MERLDQSLESFKQALPDSYNQGYRDPSSWPSYRPWREMCKADSRHVALSAVEDLMLEQLAAFLDLQSDRSVSASFVYPAFNDERNVRFDPALGLVTVTPPVRLHTVHFRKNPVKFVRLLSCLSKIQKLLTSKLHATKRDLFYQQVCLFGHQRCVDECIHIISASLQIPRSILSVRATSKGLVSGNLSFYEAESGSLVDCHLAKEGFLIPQNVHEVGQFQSTAKMILVVEKDATFQRLLQDDFFLQNCILITGKGVPDMNSRQFLRRLAFDLQLPLLGLFDPDPYGVEIMFVYRFGSKGMTWCVEPLAVPQLRWIGVHPSDFQFIEDPAVFKPFSERDLRKLNALSTRSYVQQCPQILQQLNWLKSFGKKAEIQSIADLRGYILHKLETKEWL